jgi:hypothetical protein
MRDKPLSKKGGDADGHVRTAVGHVDKVRTCWIKPQLDNAPKALAEDV